MESVTVIGISFIIIGFIAILLGIFFETFIPHELQGISISVWLGIILIILGAIAIYSERNSNSL